MNLRILVANDDGVYSPGIAALAEAAAEFGTVRIVAPDVEQSSMSHAITASRPLSYRPVKIAGFDAYRVNGTPADCVVMGSHHWEKVDVVLSGVNLGLNLGSALWHSGTLAAAKQATLLGLRGVAVSAPAGGGGPEPDFEKLRSWIRRVLETVLPDASLRLVNVNLPREPRGLMWTSVSVRQYDGHVFPMTDPYGRPVFWYGVRPITDADEGTDRWAIERSWISLTPLRVDLTDEANLAELRKSRPLDESLAQALGPKHPPAAAVQAVVADEAPKA